MKPRPHRTARGWTLVEAVVVIGLTSLVAAMVVSFIRTPMQAYVDTARRAELTDTADTALRRMTRDLRLALPNSVRIKTVGNAIHLEYLETAGGARYREYPDSIGGGDPLDFEIADTTFDVIGPMPVFSSGDSIVVFNLNADDTPTGSNAYQGDNRARYLSSTPTTVTLDAAKQFPFASPARRLHVVRQPVTYVCDPSPGVQQLRRYWGYAIQAVQPSVFAPGTGAAVLANGVTACTFAYNVSPSTQRVGVVSLSLDVANGGETVHLFQQMHVNNVP